MLIKDYCMLLVYFAIGRLFAIEYSNKINVEVEEER